MKKYQVSVVIPFKKKLSVSHLNSSVNSLINQTILPYEIILIGDKAYLNKLRFKQTIVKIKLVPFEGDKNEARNIGIKEAFGEYILYLDHDMVADKGLIENCLKFSGRFDAIIIPEKGTKGNFWENCKKLEKELITYDTHTVTPRFYRKNLFKANENPFDSRFGLLDEWGFNHNLSLKKAVVGYSDSFVLVKETDFSLKKEIKDKFSRGLWMKDFYKIDKEEAWKRVNPLNRGIIFYGKRINYLFKEPIYFPGLIVLKFIDFMAFMVGYVLGLLKRANDVTQIYDSIGEDYLSTMYNRDYWTKYVDKTEKEQVLKVLQNRKTFKKSRILDLGMGPGRWSDFFINLGFKEVYGLDISKVMVQSAQKRLRKRNFFPKLGAMEKIPFRANFFDFVFCFRAFKYSNNPEEVIKEMRRVVKKQGTIVLEVSNRSLINLISSILSRIVILVKPDTSLESRWRYFNRAHFYSEDQIRQIVMQNKLNIASVKGLFVLPSIPLTNNRFLFNFYKFLDHLIMRSFSRNLFARSLIFLITND